MPGVQRGEWEKVPVLTAAQISNMPPGQAVVLKRGLGGAFVGRTPTVLERKGWRPAAPGDLVARVDDEPQVIQLPDADRAGQQGAIA
jgi:hypothetical protein